LLNDRELTVDTVLAKRQPHDPHQAIYFMTESYKVLHQPTPSFQQSINNFVVEHNLTALEYYYSNASTTNSGSNENNKNDEDEVYYFDIALHVRYCVDCGWLMNKQKVQNNVKCFFEKYKEQWQKKEEHSSTLFSWDGTHIFVTSDLYQVIEWVKEVLPSPNVHFVHNMMDKFIHTDRIASTSANFEELSRPCLDHYMLSKSWYIGSCWTSFARVPALKTKAPSVSRLERIIWWEHSPGWSYNQSCLAISQVVL
jgi:hypothetical protein